MTGLDAIKYVAAVGAAAIYNMPSAGFVPGRGLHSSTSQLNLSHFCSLEPHQTSQLNMRVPM